MEPLWSETYWSTFKYFVILIASTYYNTIDIIQQERLQWYGHVKRMPDERIPDLIMDCIPRDSRKRGRPRKTWMEGVQAAMTTRNLEPYQWRNKDERHLVSERWRQLLKTRIDRSTYYILCISWIIKCLPVVYISVVSLADIKTSRCGDRRILTNVFVKTNTLLDNMEHLCIHWVGVACSFQHNNYTSASLKDRLFLECVWGNIVYSRRIPHSVVFFLRGTE